MPRRNRSWWRSRMRASAAAATAGVWLQMLRIPVARVIVRVASRRRCAASSDRPAPLGIHSDV
jgi:hypothetical protein